MGSFFRSEINESIIAFFANIDSSLFKAIATVYDFIITSVINIKILEPAVIRDMANRFYAILGIIVLFFIVYRLILFLINPDTMFEKGKGMGSIVNKVFMGLLLTIIIPFGFNFAARFQGAVFTSSAGSNVLEKLFLGPNDARAGQWQYLDKELLKGKNDKEGKTRYGYIGYQYINDELELITPDKSLGIWGAVIGATAGAALTAGAIFLCPFTAGGGCAVAWGTGAATVTIVAGAVAGLTVGFIGGTAKAYTDYLVASLNAVDVEDSLEARINAQKSELKKADKDPNDIIYLDSLGVRLAKGIWAGFIEMPSENGDTKKSGVTTNSQFRAFMTDVFPIENMPAFIMGDKAKEKGWGYSILFSTLSALFILYLLLMILFDLIIRALKLIIIEITAPIFIGLYIIDQNGDRFKTWLKTAMSTYFMLFTKLSLVYLSAWLIPNVIDAAGNVWAESAILYVAFILAVLYFIKSAPAWLAKLFKIDENLMNSDGAKILNGTLKGAWQGTNVAAGAAAGMVAGGASAFGGARAAYSAAKESGSGKAGSIYAGVGGFMSGSAAGVKAAAAAGVAGRDSKNPFAAWGSGKKAASKSVEKHYSDQLDKVGKPMFSSVTEPYKASRDGSAATDRHQRQKARDVRDYRDIGANPLQSAIWATEDAAKRIKNERESGKTQEQRNAEAIAEAIKNNEAGKK